MLSVPAIEHHSEQYYVAIRTYVAMKNIPTELPPLIPEVYTWIEKHNVTCNGYPFFQYLSYDKHTDLLLVSVGVPVTKQTTGDGHIIGGSFPDGDYAVVKHTGHYSQLNKAHIMLESWAEENGYSAGYLTENGQEFGSRTEFYLNDPQKEGDPDKWETNIEFLVVIKKAGK